MFPVKDRGAGPETACVGAAGPLAGGLVVAGTVCGVSCGVFVVARCCVFFVNTDSTRRHTRLQVNCSRDHRNTALTRLRVPVLRAVCANGRFGPLRESYYL